MTRTEAIAVLRHVSASDLSDSRTMLQLMSVVTACQTLGLPVDLTAPMRKAHVAKALSALGACAMREAARELAKADEKGQKKAASSTVSAAEVNALLAAMPRMETTL